MSKLRVNTVVNRTNSDKVIFPYGIGVTNGIVVSGVVTATSFVGSGISLTNVPGEIAIQQPSGETALTGITTIRVGTGMTITQPSAGIASIRPTGVLESLRVTGIATFGSTGVTTFNSSGQLRSQALGNIISQKLATKAEFTSQLSIDYDGALVHCMEDGNVYLASTTGVWNQMARANHTLGIITASGGFVATGSSVGFTGPLNSTGVSTAAFLQATTINVSAAATVGTALTVTQDLKVGRHTLVSGITTLTDLTVNNITVNGGITGKINSSGVSTITQLVATTVNASGIVTASSFSGPLTGQVNGNVIGEINSTGISTLGRISVTSINQATGISTISQLKGDSISITGVITATTFSGAHTGNLTGTATGLAGNPDIYVGFVTSKTILPVSHNTFDLGSSSNRWANIYSADMHFSNKGSSNSVDGTWGDWTLQEGENDIFMLNNRTGKRYKINLTEV